MSTNVVPLLRPQVKKPFNKVIDIKNLISSVIDWAEDQGIDVHNDIGFQIRCTDFMTYLELLAKEDRSRIHA